MRIGGGILGAGGLLVIIVLKKGDLKPLYYLAFSVMIGAPVFSLGFGLCLIGKLTRKMIHLNNDINDYKKENYGKRVELRDATTTLFNFCLTL